MTGPTLTERFTIAIEQGAFGSLGDLYTPDALLDAHVPNWRFQVHGAEAIVEQLEGWFHLPGRFHTLQQEQTASGDLLVRFEWREHGGSAQEVVSREMQLWRLRDGRIAEQVVFCAGRWDASLVEHMTIEAPLVRPVTAPASETGDGATRAAIERFDDAFGRRDVDDVMASMTDDCAFEDTAPPDGGRHEGRSAVRRCWEDLFAGAPDATFAREELILAGDRAIVRWRYDWANDGGGHVRGVDIFKVRNGRVAEKYSYVKG